MKRVVRQTFWSLKWGREGHLMEMWDEGKQWRNRWMGRWAECPPPPRLSTRNFWQLIGKNEGRKIEKQNGKCRRKWGKREGGK